MSLWLKCVLKNILSRKKRVSGKMTSTSILNYKISATEIFTYSWPEVVGSGDTFDSSNKIISENEIAPLYIVAIV